MVMGCRRPCTRLCRPSRSHPSTIRCLSAERLKAHRVLRRSGDSESDGCCAVRKATRDGAGLVIVLAKTVTGEVNQSIAVGVAVNVMPTDCS